MSRTTTTRQARAPRSVRLRMRALERTSPRRGAELAERLWFQVPTSGSARAFAKHVPTGGEPFFVLAGEAELKGSTFGDEDAPVALLVHGWGGRWPELGAHVPALVASGHRVIAWDAPSHGDSTHGAEGPGSGSVLEMVEGIQAVVGEVGRPAVVVAHSSGALAALRALRDQPPTEGYVLLAPQVRLQPAVDWFARATAMGPRTCALFLERLHQRLGLDLSELDMGRDVERMARAGSCPPMLAVHDADDPDAPPAETKRLVEAWPGAEYMPTRGLGHREVIWHEEVVARVASFLDAQSPQPVLRRLHG